VSALIRTRDLLTPEIHGEDVVWRRCGCEPPCVNDLNDLYDIRQEEDVALSRARLRNFTHIIFLEEFQESFGRFARKVGDRAGERGRERRCARERERDSARGKVERAREIVCVCVCARARMRERE